MKLTYKLSWLLVVIVVFAVPNLGCKKVKSKLQYFKDTQGPAVMTHGTINLPAAKETSDGKIEYQTTDGKTWRVDMTEQTDDTYKYGTPELVR